MADEHIKIPSDSIPLGPPATPPASPSAASETASGPKESILAGPPPALAATVTSNTEHRENADPDRDTAQEDVELFTEGMLILRWLAGMLIILASGWGFFALDVFIARSLHLDISFGDLAWITAIPAFFLFLWLEQNLWLSRFMGLRLSPGSTPLKEAIFFWLFGIVGLLVRSMGGAPSNRKRPADTGPTDTLREILETVVFVVVLVLMLKTFVAEAFVIPTGSMATSLLGYNKEVTCPMCDFSFAVNCSDEVENRENGVAVTECKCSNCGYFIRFADEASNPHFKKPWTSSGDRVLVAKPFYEVGLMAFKEFDVVVFKFPEGPQKNHVPTNFIKRLIGLPDRVIGIYGGKLYVAKRKDMEKLGMTFEPREEDRSRPRRRWIFKDRDTWPQLLEDGNKVFEILRKPPDKQLALRRPVNDNDHQARDLVAAKFPPRWSPEAGAANLDYGERRKLAQDNSAWKADSANGFDCSGWDKEEISWLRYRHLLFHGQRDGSPPAWERPPQPELITDFLSYNSGNMGMRRRGDMNQRWVGDLMLECEVKVAKAEGELVLALSKGPDRFQARWQLSSGICTLLRNGKVLDRKETDLKAAGTYRLRFSNFDERLTVWVNNRLSFDDGVSYPPPAQRGPDKPDLDPAGIGVSGGAQLSVHKLKLWRDTYYVSPNETSYDEDDPLTLDVWNNKCRLKAMTMYVQPGHYLCLGDNSPASSDSRIWGSDEAGGLVPEQLMLGRALYVYWPLYRMGPIK